MLSVSNIYPLHNRAAFSEEEALTMVNLFLLITSKAKNKINVLNSRIEYFKAQPEVTDGLQSLLNLEIQKWSDKIRRLGGDPLELYKAKITTDNGYYIWEFPTKLILNKC